MSISSTPGFSKFARWTWRDALALAGLTILGLVLNGYTFGNNGDPTLMPDQVLYIPYFKTLLNSGLYPNDITVSETPRYATLFFWLMTPLVRRVGIGWAHFLIYLLALGAYFTAVVRLGKITFGSKRVGYVAVIFLLLTKITHPGYVTFDFSLIPRSAVFVFYCGPSAPI